MSQLQNIFYIGILKFKSLKHAKDKINPTSTGDREDQVH